MAKTRFRRKRSRRSPRVLLVLLFVGLIAGIIALLWILLSPTTRSTAAGTGPRIGPSVGTGSADLSFFVTASIQGRLAPYTCEEGRLGGVARIATVFNKWAEKRRYHFRIDVGNSTVARHPAAESVNAFTFSALDKLGYDVVNCGDHEAALSLDELRALAKDRNFKLISANLVRADTRAPIFPTHLIIRRRGLNVAFIGLLRGDILPLHPGKGVRLIDPDAALRGAINLVKDKADLIVVLAFLPPEQIYELARKHPQAHLFIGGLTPVTSAACEIGGPRAKPSSYIFYLGDEGATAACLDTACARGKHPFLHATVTLLDPSVPPDPAFSGLLAEFGAALSGKPMPGSQRDPKMPCTSSYVGADVCKLCHIKEFYSWQASDHAGAYVTLLQQGKQRDPACLPCHTTGPGMPGGFDPTLASQAPPERPKTEKAGAPAPKAKPIPRLDSLKGVGCECCHGGARRHLGIALKDRIAAAKTPLLRPTPALQNCIRCHTAARPCLEPGATDTYDRNEYMERIKHWD